MACILTLVKKSIISVSIAMGTAFCMGSFTKLPKLYDQAHVFRLVIKDRVRERDVHCGVSGDNSML